MKRARDDGALAGTKIFVSNLPYSMDWADLKRVFRQAGTVLFAGVMKDKEKGTSKAWAV